MCGIVGRFEPGGKTVERSEIAGMCAALRHRGPDDEGVYLAEGLGLGMRRLSIIDLPGGAQPLYNEDKTLALVFNGEIYNYVELREELVKRGHRPATRSDGEVILHLYEEKGIEALQDLNGMYAFCLWDARRREGFLVRDRIGVKPLYYSLEGGGLRFASEIKALLAAGVRGEIDPEAVLAYLSYMYIPEPRTPFRGVRKLPRGSFIRFDREGVGQPTRYWSIPTGGERRLDPASAKDEFFHRAEDAVRLQARSDVPVGVFLSGGLDSGLITALYSRVAGGKVLSFNVQYKGAPFNEAPQARLLAERFGCAHRSVEVDGAEVLRDLPKLIWHMDEPHADSALAAAYRVSELASKEVKVILNGTGGDELFGGYERYRPNAWPLRAWHALPAAVRAAARLAPGDFARKAAFNATPDGTYAWRLLQFKPYHLEGFFADAESPGFPGPELAAAFAAAPAEAPNRYMHVDANFYMVDDLLLLLDKMTMACSIEGRVPLLDHRLVEWAFRLPGRDKVRGEETKYSMKRWLKGLLPDEILDRPKQGFGAPVRQWMAGGFFAAAARLISERPASRAGAFWGLRGDALRARMGALNFQQNYALLVLEVWYRVFADGAPPAEVSRTLTAK